MLREGPGFLPAPDVTVTLPVIRGTHAVNKGLVDSAAGTVSFTADVLAGIGPGASGGGLLASLHDGHHRGSDRGSGAGDPVAASRLLGRPDLAATTRLIAARYGGVRGTTSQAGEAARSAEAA